MTDLAGNFVWHELGTTDAASARAFYSAVLGWTADTSDISGIEYTRLSVGGTPVAGLMTLMPNALAAGARPAWTGYVGVTDVDAVASQLQKAAGAVWLGPMDIPEIGRFAITADPQGAAFALFQPATPMPAEPPTAPGAPGTVGWHELSTGNWQAAFAFYAGLFGWQKGDAIDMRAMGTYQLFTAGAGPIGGMMNAMTPNMRPSWRYYFVVDDIAAAASRVRDSGGTVTAGPHPVPGGSLIIHAVDPQGASFGLVAPR